MCKLNKRNDGRRIDKCMKILIDNLNRYLDEANTTGEYYIEIVACCCGHGKYPMSIIVSDIAEEEIIDLCSNKIIPRKRKFYKKDKQGYYYIPETLTQ